MTDAELKESTQKLKNQVLADLGATATLDQVGKYPGLFKAVTLRNMKSKRTIPENVFFRSPLGLRIDVDRFMDWYCRRCEK